MNNLVDLKNQSLSVEERVASILKNTGFKGDERTVTRGLKKGDLFSLVDMKKNTFTTTDGVERESAVYEASNGASFAPRHLSGVIIDGFESVNVGTDTKGNASFLVFCVDHNVVFKCVKIEEIERTAADKTTYTQKEFTLTVDSIGE